MKWLYKLRDLDKLLSSSFIAALIVAVLAFVAGTLYDREPQLQYEIISQSPVFDIKENVTDLEVFFEGHSLRQQHQMLSLITIRVQNIGNAGISKQISYDPSALPGFRITGSTIAKVDILIASNDYLATNLQLSRISRNEYTFLPIIIDKGDFFVLKFLAVHDETTTPRLESLGKISGKKTILAATIPNHHEGGFIEEVKNFTESVLSGSITVQAARIVVYPIGVLILLLATVIISAEANDRITKRKRRKHVTNFELTLGAAPDNAQKCLFDLYVEFGESAIVNLNRLLSKPEEVSSEVQRYKARSAMGKSHWKSRIVGRRGLEQLSGFVDTDLFGRLLRHGILVESPGQVMINPIAIETGQRLETFLSAIIPERMRKLKNDAQGKKGTEIMPTLEPAADHDSPGMTGTDADSPPAKNSQEPGTGNS